MRATIPLALLLLLPVLAGCVESTGRGGYDDENYEEGRSYPPGPPPPGYGPGYYGPGPGYYGPGPQYRGGQGSDYHRQRDIEANCNMNWQNCAGVCNTMANAQQRAVCVANCNNALNQCKGQ